MQIRFKRTKLTPLRHRAFRMLAYLTGWMAILCLNCHAVADNLQSSPSRDLSGTRVDDDVLWSLRPVSRPEIPERIVDGTNPIDYFLHVDRQRAHVKELCAADKLTWLRRVSLDLIGLPPTLEEQAEFEVDQSEGAYDRVVSRLLENPQHGVRYARHWLDVLRYTDVDERAPAADQLYLWRDWVIAALNQDVPYDQFVRAQITGYRTSDRSFMTATGQRRPKSRRPDDLFALGFLSRGATNKSNSDEAIGISAVETISSAFMAMTVGCAKCHDHFYDPIQQRDFYGMKALFDPLVLEPVNLATATQMFDYGRELTAYESQKSKLEVELDRLIEPYHTRLYNERVAMLPPDVQEVIRKSPASRTSAEQKIADDYYPILRIDSPKLKEIMPPEVVKRYDEQRRKIDTLRSPPSLPIFLTVREDDLLKQRPRYILNSGDASRPEEDRPVEPGFPFADATVTDLFRDGLREGFVDWLTSPTNPLFARVAVNRIWQWHFGKGLHARSSDFGYMGGEPEHPELLDWLAAEFVAQGYSMKWLHRTIVTSAAYRQASSTSDSFLLRASALKDPDNTTLWRFPLQRLDAETLWDALHFAAADLDTSIGGPSFRPSDRAELQAGSKRRGAYMVRGYEASRDVTPEFLRVFDVEDGRLPCPLREKSVTAPQSLLLFNSTLSERAAAKMAARCLAQCPHDLSAAVSLAYRLTLCRVPSPSELHAATEFLAEKPDRFASFCHVMFNLDEFLYVP